MCWYICISVHLHVETRTQLRVSSQSLFSAIGSLVVASRLDWLANKSQGSVCLQILGTGIAMMHQVLSCGSREGIHIFMLCGSPLTKPFSWLMSKPFLSWLSMSFVSVAGANVTCDFNKQVSKPREH